MCYEGSFLKIYSVLLADEFTSSKNTHNANFAKICSNKLFKAIYCRYLVGDTRTFYFFLFVFNLEKSLVFCFEENYNHSNIALT